MNWLTCAWSIWTVTRRLATVSVAALSCVFVLSFFQIQKVRTVFGPWLADWLALAVFTHLNICHHQLTINDEWFSLLPRSITFSRFLSVPLFRQRSSRHRHPFQEPSMELSELVVELPKSYFVFDQKRMKIKNENFIFFIRKLSFFVFGERTRNQ